MSNSEKVKAWFLKTTFPPQLKRADYSQVD